MITERFRKANPGFGYAAFGSIVNPKMIRFAQKFEATAEELHAVRTDLTMEQIKTRMREICAASLYPTEMVLSRLMPDDL